MILRTAAMFSLVILMTAGCGTVERILYDPLTEDEVRDLNEVRAQMLAGQTFEAQIDRRIDQAVGQMARTLKPEFTKNRMGKYKLGFLEITDIDRNTVTALHNYVTEKALTFSFLHPKISRNFSIVERFLIKDVVREMEFENTETPRRVVDQNLAQELGQIYHLDVIETGVTIESPDFLDITLRMIETKRGRIIAVGSVKIEKTAPVRRWMERMGEKGFGWGEY